MKIFKFFNQLNVFDMYTRHKYMEVAMVASAHFQNAIFINKLLNLIIIDSFSKSGIGPVVESLFLIKVTRNLLESHNFLKFGKKR